MSRPIPRESPKWAPEFAQGLVRDLRVRWALEEAGIPYAVRLLAQGEADTPEYRKTQPWGQVPVIEEDGLVLFESGSIIFHILSPGTTQPKVKIDEQQQQEQQQW